MTAPVTRQFSTAAAARNIDTFAAFSRNGKSEPGETSFSFGPFQLFPRRRCLLRDGQPVQLGSRSLDILTALAEQQGDIVGKSDLVARAWPGITVDESGLRVHITGLRKALGEDCDIKNVAGRGYCLVVPALQPQQAERSGHRAEVRSIDRLPLQLDGMIGRNEAVTTIAGLLQSNRFVTIHGPGAAGKTTTAVAVGHAQLSSFEGAVHFLDLGQISEAHRLPVALASQLGLPVASGDPLAALLDHLRGRRMLLIFDSCEHLIEPAAALVERIFHGAPQVSILATSREMLRVDGEHVYRLSGLTCPPDRADLSAEQVLAFDAPRLFVKRVVASGYQFQVTDADALVVARICRKLDGLALAINVAAARVPVFGLPEVANSLESDAWLFWRGQRTALPRHQTMAAAIDWSYRLLGEEERAVLHQLSGHAEFFTLDVASSAARRSLQQRSNELQMIDNLVTKSLISFDVGEHGARYRLLNSIRTYALEKAQQRRLVCAAG